MQNLFSAFDPTSVFGLSLNWLSSLSCLLLVSLSTLYLAKTPLSSSVKICVRVLHLEFSSILGAKAFPGSTWFLLSLWVCIFINNILGLFPYIFTASSHLTFSLALALPLWVGHIIYSWACQPSYALAHLVPKGTPAALTSFMVVIELVSNLIRPLTLSVRLMANLTAGHLLLCLLSLLLQVGALGPEALVVLTGLVLLMVLEIAVSFIQAYVFTLLNTLYLEEVQTKQILK